MNTPDWFADAACKGHPTEWWFPDVGQTADRAIAICNTCPVQQQCAEAGHNEPYGIWGGRGIRKRRHVNASAKTTHMDLVLDSLEATPGTWVSWSAIAERSGVSWNAVSTSLNRLKRKGLVDHNPERREWRIKEKA